MSSVAHIQYGVVSGAGVVLPPPHSAGMQSSLPLLKKNYKFNKIFFWGKIMGVKEEAEPTGEGRSDVQSDAFTAKAAAKEEGEEGESSSRADAQYGELTAT